MSSPAPTQTHTLSDFAELLRELEHEAIEYVVIGRAAIGVYARLAGEVVVSADLDLYLSEQALHQLLS